MLFLGKSEGVEIPATLHTMGELTLACLTSTLDTSAAGRCALIPQKLLNHAVLTFAAILATIAAHQGLNPVGVD